MKPIKCRNNFTAFLIVLLLIVFHIASPKEFCMAYADITNTEPLATTYCALWISSVLRFVQSWNCFLETLFSNSTINPGTGRYCTVRNGRITEVWSNFGAYLLDLLSIYIAREVFSGKMRMCGQYNGSIWDWHMILWFISRGQETFPHCVLLIWRE